MFKSQQFTETIYDEEAPGQSGEVSILTAQQTRVLWTLPNSSGDQGQENGELESSQPASMSSLPTIKRQSKLSSTAVLLGKDSLTFLKLII